MCRDIGTSSLQHETRSARTLSFRPCVSEGSNVLCLGLLPDHNGHVNVLHNS